MPTLLDMRLERAIAASAALATAAAVAAGTAAAAIPGTGADVRGATTAQRAALRVLRSSHGSVGWRYRASLGRANAALSHLRALEGTLATAARTTGLVPNGTSIQRWLGVALAADSRVATDLQEALWLLAHGAPATTTSPAELCGFLRQATAATVRLARLTS